VLFSHEAVVAELSRGFECAWTSVRPVPRATFDFGDGRRLERTLRGNVATLFCTAGGEVFDAAAGLSSPEDYLARLRSARELFDELRRLEEQGAGRAALERTVARVHEGRAARDPGPRRGREASTADLSKRLIERPLEAAILAPLPAELASPSRLAEGVLEDPLVAALAADVEHNRARRDPAIRALLSAAPLVPHAELGPRIYRDVLGIDLADPYLGLAPLVLGGEVGRR
jgi:hypothetical protein